MRFKASCRIIGDIGDERGMIIPENPEIFAVKLVDEGLERVGVCLPVPA